VSLPITLRITRGAAPPPEPPALLFSSDWSTATGTGDTAVSDGGKWDASLCPASRADVLAVVASDGLGWSRTTNVLQVTMRGNTGCGRCLIDDVVPASTSHFGRFYWRNDETEVTNLHPTSYPTGVGGETIQIVPWGREGTASGHRITMTGGFQPKASGQMFGALLTNGVWYRYEWHIEFLTALTYRIYPRIYNASDTLLYDATGYFSSDFPWTQSLKAYYDGGGSFSIGNAEWAREFSLGNEGPNVSVDNGEHWYFADVAFSLDGWVGTA
jgi:hypothetical protein